MSESIDIQVGNYSVYDSILSQLDSEFQSCLRTQKVGDTFIADAWNLNPGGQSVSCWVVLSIVSMTSSGCEDQTCIVSVQMTATVLQSEYREKDINDMLEIVLTEIKKSGHHINQNNLLQILHDRKLSSEYLIPIVPQEERDSTLLSIADASDDETGEEIQHYYYRRDLFCNSCFQCKRVDQIVCSIQEFHDSSSSGQSPVQIHDSAVKSLISLFFHSFAITNRERSFVFKVSHSHQIKVNVQD